MEWAVIARLNSGPDVVSDLKWGQLVLYTEIERGGDWYDLLKRDVATDAQKDQIVIPENLRPNARICLFAFDLRRHVIYFEQKNVDGQMFPQKKVQKIFQKLFKFSAEAVSLDLRQPLEVALTVIPTEDAIEKVLAIPYIHRVTINLRRPNPDDISEAAARIMRELDQQGVATENIVLAKSKTAESIVLNHANREIAHVAAENGSVKAAGKAADGRREERQTNQYPVEDRLPLSDSEDPLDALFAYIQAHRA